MLPVILSILLVISLIFPIYIVVQKRRTAGVTGIKTALTSICFYLIAITNLLAYWFNFLGLWSWSITVMLLILGAYFTKYMGVSER
nr:hypothetical protein [Bacillus dakarensis]